MTSSSCVVGLGNLRSISSLHSSLIESLPYMRQARSLGQSLVWDLTNVRVDGKLSISAITAFLSFSQLLKENFSTLPKARIHHDRRLFSFISDSNCLKLIKTLELFEFEPPIGDFNDEEFGASVAYFPLPPLTPEYSDPEFNRFKDQARPELNMQVGLKLKKALTQWQRTADSAGRWHDRLVESIAELILNSWLWGRRGAFVGLQQHSRRLTVVVADCGKGFAKGIRTKLPNVKCDDDRDALLVGATLNQVDYALRGAIDFVFRYSGWVELHSRYHCIKLWEPMWRKISSDLIIAESDWTKKMLCLREALGKSIAPGGSSDSLYGNGYACKWPDFFPGSQIVFEITAG